MKKNYLCFVVFVLALISSCSKKDSVTQTGGEGFWTTQNNSGEVNTYNINSIERKNDNGHFVLSGMFTNRSEKIEFHFLSTPVHTTVYQIVLFTDTTSLKADDLGIKVINPVKNQIFYSTGDQGERTWLPPAEVSVVVDKGKITLNVPKVLVTSFGTSDSTGLVGQLIEK